MAFSFDLRDIKNFDKMVGVQVAEEHAEFISVLRPGMIVSIGPNRFVVDNIDGPYSRAIQAGCGLCP